MYLILCSELNELAAQSWFEKWSKRKHDNKPGLSDFLNDLKEAIQLTSLALEME